MAHIISYAIKSGQYPDMWKFETITPVPKVYPPEEISQLRKISGLKNFAKIFDSFLAEYITKDMLATQDPAQYGNKNGVSTQHYPLPGRGAQGGQLGQLEYLSQSDNNADFLDQKEKYKFIDDL